MFYPLYRCIYAHIYRKHARNTSIYRNHIYLCHDTYSQQQSIMNISHWLPYNKNKCAHFPINTIMQKMGIWYLILLGNRLPNCKLIWRKMNTEIWLNWHLIFWFHKLHFAWNSGLFHYMHALCKQFQCSWSLLLYCWLKKGFANSHSCY